LDMNFRQGKIIGYGVVLIGLMGLLTGTGEISFTFWRYIWPFIIIAVGLGFVVVYLVHYQLPALQRKVGLLLGIGFFIYGILFYVTFIFDLRWTFLLFLLFVISGGGAVFGEEAGGDEDSGILTLQPSSYSKYDSLDLKETRVEEILTFPAGLLGIFSVYYLTFSYINENYGSFIYPVALVLWGLYLIHRLKKYEKRIKLKSQSRP